MLLSDLQNKDIVSVTTGNNLGKIIDVEIDNEGKITKLYVEQRKLLMRFKGEDTVFKYSDIVKIGVDVILINT